MAFYDPRAPYGSSTLTNPPNQTAGGATRQTLQTNPPTIPPPMAHFQYNANLPTLEQLHALGPQYAQLAAVWNQPQNGVIPPPPFPFPFNGFPIPAPPVLGTPPNNNNTNTLASVNIQSRALPSTVPRRGERPITGRVTEIVEAEKEDGEVSEGDFKSNATLHPSHNGILATSSNALHTLHPAPNPAPNSSQQRAQANQQNSRPPSTQSHSSDVSRQSLSHSDTTGMRRETLNKLGKYGEAFFQGSEKEFKSRARAFVQDWTRIGYSFADLVREGVPASHLRESYEELQLPTTGVLADPVKQAAYQDSHAQGQFSRHTIPQIGDVRNLDQTERDPDMSTTAIATKLVLLDESTKTIVPGKSSAHPSQTGTSLVPPNKSTKASTRPGAAGLPLTRKTTEPPTDRQEYIARLMAAKAGKSQPAKPPSEQKQQQLAISGLTTPQQPLASDLSSNTIQALKDDAAHETSTVKPRAEASPDPALKKRAQTELARLRIEALKKANVRTGSPARSSRATSPTPSGTESSDDETRELYGVQSETKPSKDVASPTATWKAQARMDVQRPTVQPAQSTPSVPFGGIPGLSLVGPSKSAPEVETPITSSTPRPLTSKGTKRPIPSDFTGPESERVPTPLKRPFGQSRFDESVIIHVSEDEDVDEDDDYDGSVMDIEDSQLLSEPVSSTITTNELAGPNQIPIASSMQTTLPQRPTLTRQGSSLSASAANTPSVAQTPSSSMDVDASNRQQELEKQIEEMKRKIAEREQRRLAKLEASRAQTPTTPKSQPNPIPPMNSESFGEDPKSDSRIPGLFTISSHSDPKHSLPTETGGPIELGEAEQRNVEADTYSLLHGALEIRKTRRTQLEADLFALKARSASTNARLLEIRREMEILETENQQQIADEARLTAELELFIIEAQEISHQEPHITHDPITKSEEDTVVDGQKSPVPDGRDDDEQYPDPTLGRDAEDVDRDRASSISSPAPQVAGDASDNVAGHQTTPEPSDPLGDEMEMSSDSDDGNNIAEEPQPEENSPTERSYHQNLSPIPKGSPDHAECKIDEDFYSPAPSIKGSEHMAEDGEIEVVEKKPDGSPCLTEEQVEDAQMQDECSDASEDYEPPEATCEEIHSAANSDDEYEPPDSVSDILQIEPGDQIENAAKASAGNALSPSSEAPISIIDDLAPELQPALQLPAVEDRPATTQPTLTNSNAFTPYRSPLKMFKSYRFHPDYLDNISGGFRSLTYSHNIDPNQPICPFEAAGGVCNDAECGAQHFRDMVVSDDKIVCQVGIPNPGRTETERQQWVEGIKQVIKNLRQTNTQDPNVVASEISNFRRSFLQDPTRVVSL